MITIENRELPIVSAYTFFKVGSRNERPGITGISHLFEHMMFNGSKKFGPKEFDRILESGGGYSNAYTSYDLTVYYEDFTSSLLETVLDLESDRMANLDLTQKKLTSEREVVKEERRLRTDNSVFGRLEEELNALSYQAHPYRWPIIGWLSDIENISLTDCNNYFKEYYGPNNATMVLSGDFDTEEAQRLVEKYYKNIPSGREPLEPTTVEPPQHGEKRLAYKKEVELDSFMIAYHVPDIGNEDVYALDILQIILTDGESSRLYKGMVREEQLALFVTTEFSWSIDPGLFVILAQMKPGKKQSVGEKFITKELEKLKNEHLTTEELQRAINILESDFIYSLQTNSGRGHRLGLSEVKLGGYKKMFDPVLNYHKVTVEDIQRVVQKYFTKENKSIVWYEK